MKKTIKIFSTLMAAAFFVGIAGCASGETPGGTEKTYYEISLMQDDHGTISADKTQVAKGDVVTFTASPAENYYLDKVIVNGKEIETESAVFTLCDIQNALSVSAEFAYGVESVAFETETGEEIPPVSVIYGRQYGQLPVAASQGNKIFAGWQYEGRDINSASLVAVKGNHTLTAKYDTLSAEQLEQLKPYSLTVMYYDAMALSLGVSFHTDVKPFDAVLQISEGTEFKESEAETISADTWAWEYHYVNQLVIGDLEFDKAYTYRVGDAVAGVWSDCLTLKTRADSQASSFLYVADTQQTNYNETLGIEKMDFTAVLEAAVSEFDFDYIVHGGDIVNHGGDVRCWKEMLGNAQSVLGRYPMIYTAGNHEHDQYYAVGVDRLFQNMFNINLPAQTGAQNGGYYSLDIGAMHMTVLRTNDFDVSGGKFTREQVNWLTEDLARANADEKTAWNVILMHEGIVRPISQEPSYTNHSAANRKELMKIFRDGKVDLVLYGHDHFHATSYPLDFLDDDKTDLDKDGYADYIRKISAERKTEKNEKGEEIVFYEGYRSGEQGTVFHEVGSANRQFNATFHHDTEESDKEKWVYHDSLKSGGSNRLFGDSKAYAFYDYVEVTENIITVRSYALNYEDWCGEKIGGKFIYGFRLCK